MTRSPAATLRSHTIYEGRIFRVTVDRVRMPHNREVDLEIVRHRGSVVLIPMPDPSHVVLVRQYRYAIDQWLWELPAGTLEPGEEPETAARRECHEEIDLLPGRLEPLGGFHPTPGYCTERMVFFRATNLSRPEHKATPDADEHLEPRVFELEAARQLVRAGTITDMKTALGLAMADVHR